MATCPTCKATYGGDVTVCTKDGDVLLPDEAFSNVDQELEAGDAVGEYIIDDKLGEGGFGAVFQATHPLIGKRVAVKVLNRQYSASPAMVTRFISEARAVNQIRHKSIIDIFSFGQLVDGRHYYVMELLEGAPLDRLLKARERLSIVDALPILRPLARALDAVHEKGIFHRDLKPANVFICTEDDAIFPKLLDFGIAKLGGGAPGSPKTQTGAPLGTPYYMSPEQCRGKSVDQRTDVYSFGVLVYQTLTGKLPFDDPAYMEILFKQMTETAAPPSSICPEIPAALDEPILWMLAKDPEKRPQSLGEALRALEAAAVKAGLLEENAVVSTSPALVAAARAVASTPVAAGAATIPLGKRAKREPVDVAHAATVASSPMRPVTGPRGRGATGPRTPGPAHSFVAAEARPTGRRGSLYVGVAAVIVAAAGAGALWFVKRGPGEERPTPAVVATSAPVFPDAVPAPRAVAVPAAPALDAPAPSRFVKLEVTTDPDGAALELDGEAVTPPGPFSVERGSHKLEVSAKDFEPKSLTLDVMEDTNYSVVLKEKPRTSGSGSARPPRPPTPPTPPSTPRHDKETIETPDWSK